MNNGTELPVIETFDKVALIPERWDHNTPYHGIMLQNIPSKCPLVLDIGCGTGLFSEVLAATCSNVVGIDISDGMITEARKRHNKENIDYILDGIEHYLHDKNEVFAAITSLASFHHMDQEKVLGLCKKALQHDGVLVIMDLYKEHDVVDYLFSCVSMIVNPIMQRIKNGYWRVSENERKAWGEHMKYDKYLTIKEIQKIGERILGKCEVKRKLFWRYVLTYKKE